MRHSIATMFACVALVACGPNAATTEPPAAPVEEQQSAAPANVGDCVQTTVTVVGPRLEGLPDSGSSVTYANGLYQVSYDVVPAITNTQAGDEVRLCLVSIPENCPPGDNRGRFYDATNLRTNETWSAPDSQHMCGGA